MSEKGGIFLDIIFPVQCVGCGFFAKEWWCARCAAACPQKIIKQTIDWLPVFSATRFTAPGVPEIIHAFKYRSVFVLRETLAQWLHKTLLEIKSLPSSPEIILVPVPLHSKRLAERGFNQTELLAAALLEKILDAQKSAALKNLIIKKSLIKKITICSPQFIVRQRHTKQQAKSTETRRAEQIKNAFKLQERVGDEKIYIIIDDVVTTGSTLLACANLIRRAGARRIIGLTVASASG